MYCSQKFEIYSDFQSSYSFTEAYIRLHPIDVRKIATRATWCTAPKPKRSPTATRLKLEYKPINPGTLFKQSIYSYFHIHMLPTWKSLKKVCWTFKILNKCIHNIETSWPKFLTLNFLTSFEEEMRETQGF